MNAEAKEVILPVKINKSTQYELFDRLVSEKGWTEKELRDRVKVEQVINEMYTKGCRPIVGLETARYEDIKKSGGRLHTGKQNVNVSFGVTPSAENQQLLLMDIPLERLAPVYDGPNYTFRGRVLITGGQKIGLDSLSEFEFEPEPEPEVEKPKIAVVEETREAAKETVEEEVMAEEVKPVIEVTEEEKPTKTIQKISDSKQFTEFEKTRKEAKSAKEIIAQLYAKGVRPVISVDDNIYNEVIQTILNNEQISSDKLKGVVTIGRTPSSKRLKLLMLDIDQNSIEPVFGGPHKKFTGGVKISPKAIEPDKIKEIEYTKPETQKIHTPSWMDKGTSSEQQQASA